MSETVIDLRGERKIVISRSKSSTQGPPGPTGPQGNSGGSYTHHQDVPASRWVMNHNLGYIPGGVKVYDSAGTECFGSIPDDAPPTINQLTIDFGTASFGGLAYLS